MLRSSQVLRVSENVRWRVFAEMADAMRSGGVLEMIAIMEYVWERTNRVLVNEALLGGPQ